MIDDYSKQVELIQVGKFQYPIHIIGAGATGSWVALILLKMGFKNIHIYDFDDIEEHNIPNQLYREKDIGKTKSDSMWNIYQEFFNDGVENRLTTHNQKVGYKDAKELEGIVFNCVDSMKGRKTIYEGCIKHGKAILMIESRIGLFGAYMYTVEGSDRGGCESYENTLYADEEAEVSVCGVSQTALPAALNCASLLVMQMISWFRGNDIYNAVQYQIPDLFGFRERWD